jgi:hypothetical protein
LHIALLTGSFMDYAMPRADNFCAVVMEDNPVPTPTNPLGVKGAVRIMARTFRLARGWSDAGFDLLKPMADELEPFGQTLGQSASATSDPPIFVRERPDGRVRASVCGPALLDPA